MEAISATLEAPADVGRNAVSDYYLADTKSLVPTSRSRSRSERSHSRRASPPRVRSREEQDPPEVEDWASF